MKIRGNLYTENELVSRRVRGFIYSREFDSCYFSQEASRYSSHEYLRVIYGALGLVQKF